jgi:hypothetical protein
MSSLVTELVERLVADFGFRRQGDWLRYGRCPACGKPEAYFHQCNPYVVCCPRAIYCPEKRTYTRTLYPELFLTIARRHPPTTEEPDAPARAYLGSRGLALGRLAGAYALGTWWVERDGKRRKVFTVRFRLPNGSACHRLIDYAGKDKNRFEGSYQGQVWLPPGFVVKGEVWLTEGILDAASLGQAGLRAVATISASHVPARWLESLRGAKVALVIALDNDAAGRAGAAKLARACRDLGLVYSLAFPPEGADWNDLLLSGALDEKRRADTLAKARWRGRLAMAETAQEYYDVWREGGRGPLFDFKGAYWRGTEEGVRPLSDFVLVPHVMLGRKAASGQLEYATRMEVNNHQRRHQVTLDARELVNSRDFKVAIYQRALANWFGGQRDLDLVIQHILRRNPPVAYEISAVGYDADADAYFFPDTAYGPDGTPAAPDGRGFFQVGRDLYSLSLSSDERAIPREGALELPGLLEQLRAALGQPALAALGFYTAALFAEQFSARPHSRFFPFLSFYGDINTGKSSLTHLLNRMLGRNVREGMSVSEVDTKRGPTRAIASVSNLPVAILEMDDAKARRFDLNRILTLYNREPLQVRALTTNDNRYHSTSFRGALLFSQNFERFEGEAQKSRVVSLHFDKARKSEASERAMQALMRMPPGRLACFRHEVLTRRGWFQQRLFEGYQAFCDAFARAGLSDTRVVGNHALVLAGAAAVFQHALGEAAAGWTGELSAYLVARARDKEAALAELDTEVGHFFEQLELLIAENKVRDHSRNPEELAVSLVEVEAALGDKRLALRVDKNALKRSPRYLRHNHNVWRPSGGTVKCWMFKREARPSEQ